MVRIRASYWFCLLILSATLAACTSPETVATTAPPPTPPEPGETISLDGRDLVMGQVLYVPGYSEIYFADTERTWDFAITLSIHNTDVAQPIIIESIRYYGNSGNLVREHMPEPISLPPLATRSVVIPRNDNTGGVGANFIVEWSAETVVSVPVVETVMISAIGNQGLAFTSRAQVISEFAPESNADDS
jgi:hypothetical protein